jgi:serine/threonine-protein kinase
MKPAGRACGEQSMDSTTHCPDRNEWRDFVAGRLSEEMAGRMEHHLSICSTCQETVNRIDDADKFVGAIQAGGVAPTVALDARDDLQAKLLEKGRNFHQERTAFDDALLDSDTLTLPGKPVDDDHSGSKGIQGLSPPTHSGDLGRLGAYRILKVLGRGGMGVVYQAVQDRPQRTVALKMLLGSSASASRLARFVAEADVVARLQHPNIVQIFEVGEHEGRPFFTMEYIDGGSLARRLSDTPLEPTEAAQLLLTLASAVQHAHERGIIHRDLKPANILLQVDKVDSRQHTVGSSRPHESGGPSSLLSTAYCLLSTIPKIADFGLAKYFDDSGSGNGVGLRTESGAILGTPAYMAPEQAEGRNRDVGPAADIYALGAILYECLAGRPPFKAATVLEMLELIRSQEPVPPSRLQLRLPRDIQTICLKCLEKIPAKRYSSVGELADDLGRFLRQEPIKARPTSRVERLRKWARRKPAVAALLALLILCVTALLGGTLLHNAMLQGALTEAGTQRERANSNYRDAREAINRMLQRLDDKNVANSPRMNELRQHQLEEALQFYEKALHAQNNPDDSVRYDAAFAYYSAGRTEVALNSTEAAVKNLHAAGELLEGLDARDPASLKYKAILSNVYTALGSLATITDASKSVQYYEQARAVCERLSAAAPGDRQWQSMLAVAHLNCGSAYMLLHQATRAEHDFEAAVAIGKVLVRDHPEVGEYKYTLANNYVNLATIYSGRGQRARAAEVLKDAEKLLAPLVAAMPEALDYAVTLGAAYVNLGYTVGHLGRLKEALEFENKAVKTLEAILAREPKHQGAAEKAGTAHGARAEVLQALQRYAEAVKDWERFIELDKGNERRWRGSRALALAWAGNHIKAHEAACDLVGGGETHDSMFTAARVDALCAEAVFRDAQVKTTDRAGLAKAYANSAMALLQRLHKAHYFDDRAHRKDLSDPAFFTLSFRSDFQEFARGSKTGMPK